MKKGSDFHETQKSEVFIPLTVPPVTWPDRFYKSAYENYTSLSSLVEKGVCRELKVYGKKIAIFSDSQNYRLMLEAKMLGVLDNVDFILSASSIDSYKPDPSGLMLIAKKYKKDVKKCQCRTGNGLWE